MFFVGCNAVRLERSLQLARLLVHWTHEDGRWCVRGDCSKKIGGENPIDATMDKLEVANSGSSKDRTSEAQVLAAKVPFESFYTMTS